MFDATKIFTQIYCTRKFPIYSSHFIQGMLARSPNSHEKGYIVHVLQKAKRAGDSLKATLSSLSVSTKPAKWEGKVTQ